LRKYYPSTLARGKFIDLFNWSSATLGKYYPSTTAKNKFSELYAWSANTLEKFAPSTLNKNQYAEYTAHSGQTNKHKDHSIITVSGGTGIVGGGDLTTARTFSVLGYSTISSNAKKAKASGARVADLFEHSLYLQSTSKWTDLTDGGSTDLHTHTGGSARAYWSSQTNKQTGSIYYDYPIVIAKSGTSYGDYKFQVSGASYFSGSAYFVGSMSGLADPTYPSAAASKHYVDVRTPTTTQPNKVAGTIWMSGSTTFTRLYMCTSNAGNWKMLAFV